MSFVTTIFILYNDQRSRFIEDNRNYSLCIRITLLSDFLIHSLTILSVFYTASKSLVFSAAEATRA